MGESCNLFSNGLEKVRVLSIEIDDPRVSASPVQALQAARNATDLTIGFVQPDIAGGCFTQLLEALLALDHLERLQINMVNSEELTLSLLLGLTRASQLKELILHRCALSTPSPLRRLVEALPALEKLRVSECVDFDPAQIKWFQRRLHGAFT